MAERDEATQRLDRAHATIDRLKEENQTLRSVIDKPYRLTARENLRLARRLGELCNLQW